MDLFLDLETFSRANLKQVGSWKYAHDPSTEILIATYAVDDQPVIAWDQSQEYRTLDHLASLIPKADRIIAFNLPFDREVLAAQEIYIPLEKAYCAMVAAYALSFAGGLDDVCSQIGIQGKKSEGKALINLFSSPAPSNHRADRYTWRNRPTHWRQFVEYAIQDTEALRNLWRWTEARDNMSPEEWDLWRLDQQINQRGVHIDRELVVSTLELVETEKIRLFDELKKVTGLPNPNSIQQLKTWLEAQGTPTESLAKSIVVELLKRDSLTPAARQALELRQQLGKTSTAKWNAFMNMVNPDDRLRGTLQFAGASRTRRWAGRGVQLHNLPRQKLQDIERLREVIVDLPELAPVLYGDVMLVASDMVRSAITPGPGNKLVVADFASIESRVLGWLTRCRRMQDLFRHGKDTYKDFATIVYDVDYDQVTKEQRNYCKPPVLGCGFFLGYRGLMEYAAGMGVEMSEEDAQKCVNAFRENYPEVPLFWDSIFSAIETVLTAGVSQRGYGLEICIEDAFLFIRLPSGRRLAYYQPDWEEWETPIGTRDTFTFMGESKITHQWERIGVHKGHVTENIVQAIARDLLAERGIIPFGDYVVSHVHDEPILEAPEKRAKEMLERLTTNMSTAPAWAPGLILGAEGYVADRYRKE